MRRTNAFSRCIAAQFLNRDIPRDVMPQANSFNAEILAAVSSMNAELAGKGYDINSFFTHDLPYGPDCCIRANNAPKTMCVAAAVEVIVTALNARYSRTQDRSPFQKLPLRSWQRGSRRDIRAHIFMYAGLDSHGTAHALERFGIGKQVPFSEVLPGGFINFNRSSGSGHACVFLSYIDGAGNDLATFGPGVVGFRYFSAQGMGLPDAGFGYRWAFFDGHCPETLPAGRRRDCKVIRSDSPKILCCGYMLDPSNWPAQAVIDEGVRTSATRSLRPEIQGHELEAEMGRELPFPDLSRFDGVTVD
jgi:hypothetical protein